MICFSIYKISSELDSDVHKKYLINDINHENILWRRA